MVCNILHSSWLQSYTNNSQQRLQFSRDVEKYGTEKALHQELLYINSEETIHKNEMHYYTTYL